MGLGSGVPGGLGLCGSVSAAGAASLPSVTVSIPTGISQSETGITAASRRWAGGVYTDIRHWNQLNCGGHFAAFEEPDDFVDEIRTSFGRVR